MGPVTRRWQVRDSTSREWSSSHARISASAPGRPPGRVSRQWVKPDCQHSLGSSAANRRQDDLGRFFGSGVISPARVRYRLIVAAGTAS